MNNLTIAQLYEYAKLATAAYIMPKDDDGNILHQTNPNMRDYIIGSYKDNRLPTALAEAVFGKGDDNNKKWTIPNGGYYDNDGTGFAATLYKSGNETVLAIRGTEASSLISEAFYKDGLIADLSGIGFDGFASLQTVQMINYIEKAKAVNGKPYQQLEIISVVPPLIPEGAVLLRDGLIPLYLVSTEHTATSEPIIKQGDNIILTGHSLGGHLATMAKRLYPDLFSETFIYNAPGFNPPSSSSRGYTEKFVSAFEKLIEGANPKSSFESLLASGFYNVESEDLAQGNDVSAISSITTGSDVYGKEINIPVEANSHMVAPIMDVLGMLNLLDKMMPQKDVDINERIKELTAFLEVIRWDDTYTLETLTQKLHALFNNGASITLAHADATSIIKVGVGDVKARDDYYIELLELEKKVADATKIGALNFSSLVGLDELFDIVLSEGSYTTNAGVILTANDILAYRYAVVNLNPFVITGEGINYEDIFNKNNELNLYNIENNPKGTLTTEYLLRHTEFLMTLMNINQQTYFLNANHSYHNFSNIYMKDAALGETIEAAKFETEGSYGYAQKHYYFGKEIKGDEKGIDTVDVSINEGITSSYYGYKESYVFTGSGDDNITFGGRGSDYIEGGRGTDTYTVKGEGEHKSFDVEGNDIYKINVSGAYVVEDIKGDDEYTIQTSRKVDITDYEGKDTYTILNSETTTIKDYKGDDTYTLTSHTLTPNKNIEITDEEGKDTYILSEGKIGYIITIHDKGKDGAADAYTINDIGRLTINDADGIGSLTVGGQSLNGMDFNRSGINAFISSDGIWRLEQVLNADRTIKHYLLQKKHDKGHWTIAVLEGWQDEKNHLGMTLNEAPKPSTGDISTGNNLMGHTPWLGHEFLPENYFGEGNSHTVMRSGGNLSLHHMLGYSGLPNGPIAVIFDDYPSQILGSSYGDQIQLGNGNNIVTAGLGNDFIITGDGNDWISSGISYVSELSDKDYVIAGKGADYIYGGKDDDTIISDGTEALNQTNSDERGDFVTASDGNDTVYGSNAKDILMGGAGEDTIYGGGGDDLILGDGDYQLRRATLISTDVPFLDFKWNEAGYFEYTLSKGVSLTMIPTTFSWDWTLDGSGGADITYKNSASKTDWLTEGGANDIIHGGAGDDWIAGQTGSDVIYGGEGDDIIYGDDIKPMDEALEGNDIIYGGRGADTIYGGGGNDSLFAGEINQTPEELNADTDQDLLYGGKGDDLLYATGGGDLLYGEEGNDTLIAAHGAKLYGGEGNDILVASKANNAELNGDEGDDTFYAGEGNNVTLNGGTGNDTFHLSTGKNTYINAGSGTNRYFITKETYSQGGETVIANDSGLWELYLDGRRITVQDLVRETEAGALLTRDNQYVLSNLGGDLYIGSLNMSYTGWVVIKNGALQGSFTELWDSSEDINNKTPETVGVIDNQLANKGDQFSLNITDYFEDDNPLKYSAFLEDGSELPNWLTIDEDTGLISGTPIDDQVSMINIIIIARDPHNKVIWQAFTLDVNKGSGGINQAPIINHSQDNLILDEKAVWSYQLSNALFSDPDGDQLTYKVVMNDGSTLPSWLIFDQNTLTLSGTAGNSDVGLLNLKVIATDPEGLSAKQGFNVTINNVNDAPIVTGIVNPMSTKEGDAFSWTLPSNLFSDIDAIHGDQLSYSITLADGSKLPSWLSFDPATGLLSGTPTAGDNGDLSLKITATDLAGASAAIDFGMTIEALVIPNRAPMINNPQDNLILDEKAAWSYQLSNALFSDPDGDQLTYKVVMNDGSKLPSWMIFDPINLTLSGTAGNSDVGLLNLKVIATDPKGLSAEQSFNVTINNVNDAPIVTGIVNPMSTKEGDAFSWTLPSNLFSDIDMIHGDQLSYSITLADGSKLPSWLSFNPATGLLSGTPTAGDNGNLSLKITATDLAGASAAIDFGMTIEALIIPNRAPIINNPQDNLALDEKAVWSYQLSNALFSDPDGDQLTYKVVMNDGSTLPSWLIFDQNTLTLSGTAGNSDVGHLNLKVIATDPDGLSAEQGFNVTINNINDAPVAQGTLANQTTEVGKDLLFNLPAGSFSDLDLIHGDKLTYSLRMADGSIVPSWLTINTMTGMIQGKANVLSVLGVLVVATDLSGAEATHALTIEVASSRNIINGTEGNDILNGTAGDDAIYGGAGNDTITDNVGNNLMDGGAGDDKITGTGTFIGGVGNDTLTAKVRGSTDTFVFNLGDGMDTIVSYDPAQAIDTLKFGEGITSEMISYRKSGLHLIVVVGDQGDQITLNNYFLNPNYQTINHFEFADGSVWDDIRQTQLTQYYTDSAEVITGTPWDDIIYGLGGNDTITDSEGNNWLDGGAGDDKITGTGTFVGGIGNDTLTANVVGSADTFVFNLGDGKDTIISTDSAKTTDTLKFGEGITSEMISYRKSGLHLIVVVGDQGDQITLNNYFLNLNYQTVNRLEFADGSVCDDIRQTQLTQYYTDSAEVITGTPWDDIIYGLGGNDTITDSVGNNTMDGGAGNDKITGKGTFIGGIGNDTLTANVVGSADTFIFNLGDGMDTIVGIDSAKTTDTLKFGVGITSDMVTHSQVGNNLILTIGSTGDKITVNNYFLGSNYRTLNAIEFADGTKWTANDQKGAAFGYQVTPASAPYAAPVATSAMLMSNKALAPDKPSDHSPIIELREKMTSIPPQKYLSTSMDQNPLTALYEADTYGANTGSNGMKAEDARVLQSLTTAMAAFGTGASSSNDLIDNDYSMVARVFAPTN